MSIDALGFSLVPLCRKLFNLGKSSVLDARLISAAIFCLGNRRQVGSFTFSAPNPLLTHLLDLTHLLKTPFPIFISDPRERCQKDIVKLAVNSDVLQSCRSTFRISFLLEWRLGQAPSEFALCLSLFGVPASQFISKR
jgi:hypothetical protein